MPSALYMHWHLTVSSQKSAHYSKKKNPASPLRCRILFNSNHRQYLLHMHRFLENQPRTLHRKYLPVFLLQIHTSSESSFSKSYTITFFLSGSTSQYSRTPAVIYLFSLSTKSFFLVDSDNTSATKSGAPKIQRF